MNIFPEIEGTTRTLSVSHFLLMFGYKLFSLYFPLFLLAKRLSLPQIGYTYLLIYLPIALFSPVVGYLNHKINPAMLASLGILGYSLYSLGMLFINNLYLFYFWQIILGISACLFFVSSRAILMGVNLKDHNRAFAWFYSAPIYASAISPAIGALIIMGFGFRGVFTGSLLIQIITASYLFLKIHKITSRLTEKNLELKESFLNYKKMLERIKNKAFLPYLIISFFVLFVSGFYFAFFVVFLKKYLLWPQNQILLFESLLSLIFLPISLFLIKIIGERESEKNIIEGSLISGFLSVVLGTIFFVLNFWTVILIMLGRNIGNLMVGSSRSGILSTKLKKTPEESAALDTIFSPLGISLGAFTGGLLVKIIECPLLFALGGVVIILGTLSINILKLKGR